MSTTVDEDNMVILGNLDVSSSGRLNTNNLSGGAVVAPSASLTSVFFDTDTNALSYINTINGTVTPSFASNFAFIGDVNVIVFGTTEVELTFGTLFLNLGNDVTLSSGRLTLNSFGTYFIQVDMSYEKVTGNNRAIARTRLSDDLGISFLPSSASYSYHRNLASGEGSSSIYYYYQNISVNTEISVFAEIFNGAGTAQPLADACRISGKRIL